MGTECGNTLQTITTIITQWHRFAALKDKVLKANKRQKLRV